MLVRILHTLGVTSRQTNILHTGMFLLFREKSGDSVEVEYINPLLTRFDSKIHRTPNLTVVSYELLSLRSIVDWAEVKSRILPFLEKSARRVGFPQDDYTGTAYLDSFLTEHKFSAVYSAVTNDLNLLYPKFRKVGRIEHALTGYISDVQRTSQSMPLNNSNSRPTDFFSRIRKLPLYFGESARTKAMLSEQLAQGLERAGLRVDFSTRDSDALTGSKWEASLRASKATFVARGGASEVDPWNDTAKNFRALEKVGISEEWSYRLAKPLRLRRGDFSATSPRLFEALATGTVIIGPPSGLLPNMEPWKHFIPWAGLETEIAMVAEALTNSGQLSTIAENAIGLVAKSDEYSYETFVKSFLERELPQEVKGPGPVQGSISKVEKQIKSVQTARQDYERFIAEYGSPTWYNSKSILMKLREKQVDRKKLSWLEEGLLADEVSYLAVGLQTLPARVSIGSTTARNNG